MKIRLSEMNILNGCTSCNQQCAFFHEHDNHNCVPSLIVEVIVWPKMFVMNVSICSVRVNVHVCDSNKQANQSRVQKWFCNRIKPLLQSYWNQRSISTAAKRHFRLLWTAFLWGLKKSSKGFYSHNESWVSFYTDVWPPYLHSWRLHIKTLNL